MSEMNKIVIRSLGFDISWNAFASIEDFNEAYKANNGAPCDNPALVSCNKNTIYRSSMAQGRKLLCDKVEQESGFERETKVVGQLKSGEDKVEYAQKESVYISAAIDSGAITQERVGEIYQEIVDGIVPDPSGRTPAEKKPSRPQKKFVEAATKFVEAGRGEEVAGKIAELIGKEVTPDINGIAIGLQLDAKRREDEQLNSF